MSTAGRVRLDSRTSVERVLAARTYLRVFMPRLEVAAPGMDENSIRTVQARVDKLADECGCGLGAAVALASLAAWGLYAATIGPPVGVWEAIWRGAAAMFVGATIGKLVGIARARVELRALLLRLREEIA